jgi:hypothetical protein
VQFAGALVVAMVFVQLTASMTRNLMLLRSRDVSIYRPLFEAALKYLLLAAAIADKSTAAIMTCTMDIPDSLLKRGNIDILLWRATSWTMETKDLSPAKERDRSPS